MALFSESLSVRGASRPRVCAGVCARDCCTEHTAESHTLKSIHPSVTAKPRRQNINHVKMLSFSAVFWQKMSSAIFAAMALLSISGSFADAITRPGENTPETAVRYEAFHKALVAAAFPEDIEEKCLESGFTDLGSWNRSKACTVSKGSRSWVGVECTSECVEYFETAGVDCELNEDAAKAQVAKALKSALKGSTMKGKDKQALYAWYRFYYSLYGYSDEENVKVDTLVSHIREELDSASPSESTLNFMKTQVDDDSLAGWESGSKDIYIAKCIKAAASAAGDSTPSSSALSHGAFVSGVLGIVAYAALLL